MDNPSAENAKEMKHVKIVAEVRPLRPIPGPAPVGFARTNNPGGASGHPLRVKLAETAPRIRLKPSAQAPRGLVRLNPPAGESGRPLRVNLARPAICLKPVMPRHPAVRIHPFSGRIRISNPPTSSTQPQEAP
jgi:hypothetical protein